MFEEVGLVTEELQLAEQFQLKLQNFGQFPPDKHKICKTSTNLEKKIVTGDIKLNDVAFKKLLEVNLLKQCSMVYRRKMRAKFNWD